jgi:hypothetical protein
MSKNAANNRDIEKRRDNQDSKELTTAAWQRQQ